MDAPAIHIANSVHLSGEVNDAVRRDHFTGVGERTEARRDIQRSAAEAALDRDRFARVDADSDTERQVRVSPALVLEAHLEVDCCPKSLPRRSENGERLVSAHFDDRPSAHRHAVSSNLLESRRKPGGGLVTVILGKPRVPADVGDQECANVGAKITRLASVCVVWSALRSVDSPV
jgi:hypothetical protein